MHTRGRYSPADLSIVSPDGPREPPPEPPAYFNEREVVEWRTIVECLPQDFFPRESLALLTSYVSIACQLEVITRELSRFKEGPPRDAAKRILGADQIPRSVGPATGKFGSQTAASSIGPQ